jgi:hypothetical protein
MDTSTKRLRIGLILAAAVLVTGALAAVVADAMAPAATPSPQPLPPATGGPGQAPGSFQLVPAPIDGLEMRIRESAPPQYSVYVQAGLPSGCAKQHSHSVQQTGDTFIVQVMNSMPPGNPICTMIYGTYELNLDLKGDIRPGRTYTVKVNDRTTTFVAQ